MLEPVFNNPSVEVSQITTMDPSSQPESDNEKQANPEVIALLRQVTVLAVLPDKELEQLALKARSVIYRAGEFVVRQNKAGSSLFVIQSGLCEVFVKDQQGFDNRVAQVSKGDFFGEMSLLTGAPSTATVRALEDSTLVVIDKALFTSVIQSNPKTSEALGKVLAQRQKELAQLSGGTEREGSSSSGLVKKIKSFFRTG